MIDLWDVYDLGDDELLRHRTEAAAVASGDPAHAAAQELLTAITEELRERGVSAAVVASIAGDATAVAAPPDPQTPGVLECGTPQRAPQPSTTTTATPVPAAPPATGVESSDVSVSQTVLPPIEGTGPPASGDGDPFPPRRRGLWDSSSDGGGSSAASEEARAQRRRAVKRSSIPLMKVGRQGAVAFSTSVRQKRLRKQQQRQQQRKAAAEEAEARRKEKERRTQRHEAHLARVEKAKARAAGKGNLSRLPGRGAVTPDPSATEVKADRPAVGQPQANFGAHVPPRSATALAVEMGDRSDGGDDLLASGDSSVPDLGLMGTDDRCRGHGSAPNEIDTEAEGEMVMEEAGPLEERPLLPVGDNGPSPLPELQTDDERTCDTGQDVSGSASGEASAREASGESPSLSDGIPVTQSVSAAEALTATVGALKEQKERSRLATEALADGVENAPDRVVVGGEISPRREEAPGSAAVVQVEAPPPLIEASEALPTDDAPTPEMPGDVGTGFRDRSTTDQCSAPKGTSDDNATPTAPVEPARPPTSSSASTDPSAMPPVASLPKAPNAEGFDYAAHYPQLLASFLIDTASLQPVAPQDVVPRARQLLADIAAFREAREEDAEETGVRDEDLPESERPRLFFRAQRSRSEVYDLVTSVLAEPEDPSWDEASGPLWDLWWSWRKPRPKEATWLATQWVNHIPRSSQLTRKDHLKAALQKYARGHGAAARSFHIMPLTFTLPLEYVAFAKCFAEQRGLWIMKQVGMSRGRGISLVADISDVQYAHPVVLQRYVDRPLVVGGRKFDLRLYAVATAFSPLTAFVSRLGFARLAPQPYTTDLDSLTDLGVHLTNTALSEQSVSGGQSKLDLEALAAHLEQRGVAWPPLWQSIKDTVLRAMTCAEDGIPNARCAFELFGFDVLIDEDLRPWVLEANASPAMDLYGPVDERVKPQLFRDMVTLLGPTPVDRGALEDLLRDADRYAVKGRPGAATKRHFNAAMARVFEGRPLRGVSASGTAFEQITPSPQYAKITRSKRAAV